MSFDLRYLGTSGVKELAGGAALSFAPNLARPRVFFDGELARPVRFREAISALHDVVVGDLRRLPKDRSAHEAWKQQEAEREARLRRELHGEAMKAELARLGSAPRPPNLEADFRKMHKLYWGARVRWANELARSDPQLFRHLVPCDPVVTVAPDVVFFECFSKDESSYGCLSVDRDAFRGAQDAGLGTTNVDYSLALYEHFQTLRSYRPTRLLVDPTGFEVAVEGRGDYREEKIDLPPSWLRGFGQLQAAMCLPCRRVDLPVEAVYSLLAHLDRHRERTGPRSLRFQLTPGKAPILVLDPWGVSIPCRGVTCDDGPVAAGPAAGAGGLGPYRSGAPRGAPAAEATEEIKVWGRRRLSVLARLLPLADRIEVRLLGSGLPSLWIVFMGEMRFTLALSGWTANDWTSGSHLDVTADAFSPDAQLAERVARHLEMVRRASYGELAVAMGAPDGALRSALHLTAKQGQVVYDHAAECYRCRPVMPVALSDALLGPEPPELAEGRRIAQGGVEIAREETLSGGRRVVMARAKATRCELLLDADGAIKKAKCSCSYFYKNRLRAGPCRHLLAVKLHLSGRGDAAPSLQPPEPPGQAEAAPRGPRAPAAAPRGEAVPFPAELLVEIERAAAAQRAGLAEVVEASWDLAFERIQGCRSWAEALALGGPEAERALRARELRAPVVRTLPVHADVLAEIRRVADQFKASPAAVVGLAWLVARRSTK
ncbi:SWIM zinc finger family protein [Sorangium sp. So ce448]|uniref:SWIM zinc finger family protein n=1 Tax=Sorangium sp. So ce448 TaxID=3133314 RepID=UPI003F5F784C